MLCTTFRRNSGLPHLPYLQHYTPCWVYQCFQFKSGREGRVQLQAQPKPLNQALTFRGWEMCLGHSSSPCWLSMWRIMVCPSNGSPAIGVVEVQWLWCTVSGSCRKFITCSFIKIFNVCTAGVEWKQQIYSFRRWVNPVSAVPGQGWVAGEGELFLYVQGSMLWGAFRWVSSQHAHCIALAFLAGLLFSIPREPPNKLPITFCALIKQKGGHTLQLHCELQH